MSWAMSWAKWFSKCAHLFLSVVICGRFCLLPCCCRLLDMGANALTGPVPDGLSNLHLLSVVDLGDNLLSSSIATTIGSITVAKCVR